jgi:pimeloyl-ACP methyl ester carboxylesterase
VTRPPLAAALAEPIRASGEYATSWGLMPFTRFLPDGDGHTVLVLPGFTASDASTRPLRRMLESLGYAAHGWGLGRNVGPTEAVVDRLPTLLERLAQVSGGPISLVGWSLGGVYARFLANRWPEHVRVVVTLGTPVENEARTSSNASGLFNALRAIHVPGHPMLDGGVPLDRPVTAVHTRTDGVVHWRNCLVETAPNAENLRVRGSHSGLGFNPAVGFIVADRLAQPPGVWVPFEAPLPYRRIITTDPKRVVGT